MESVMRHFLRGKFAPPVLLPKRVPSSPLARALVEGPGAAQRLAATHFATVARAVDLPAITRPAHVDLSAAQCTDEDSGLGPEG